MKRDLIFALCGLVLGIGLTLAFTAASSRINRVDTILEQMEKRSATRVEFLG